MPGCARPAPVCGVGEPEGRACCCRGEEERGMGRRCLLSDRGSLRHSGRPCSSCVPREMRPGPPSCGRGRRSRSASPHTIRHSHAQPSRKRGHSHARPSRKGTLLGWRRLLEARQAPPLQPLSSLPAAAHPARPALRLQLLASLD